MRRVRKETREGESRMRKRRERLRVEGRGVILGEEREEQREKGDRLRGGREESESRDKR